MARRTIQMVGVVLAAAVLGASAYNRPEASKDFKDLDMDESGHVDRAEVDAHLDRQFDVSPRHHLRLPLAPLSPPAFALQHARPLGTLAVSNGGGRAGGCCAGGGTGVDGVLRHEQGRAGPQGRVFRAAEIQPAVLGLGRYQQRRVSARAAAPSRCAAASGPGSC